MLWTKPSCTGTAQRVAAAGSVEKNMTHLTAGDPFSPEQASNWSSFQKLEMTVGILVEWVRRHSQSVLLARLKIIVFSKRTLVGYFGKSRNLWLKQEAVGDREK